MFRNAAYLLAWTCLGWDIPAPDHSSQIEQPALPSFMASKLSHPTENGKGPLLVPHPG